MKNILLAVCGLSPQILTEALYALFQEGKPIDTIQVITTRSGKNRLLTGLFDPDRPILDSLLADFGLARHSINFGSANIHTLKTETGVEIDDIITPADNEILLKTCLELTFSLTRDENSAVYFLVAGGRKTMTSCLTLAAQLYGRSQDRLLHVLVSPEFENSADFWYPPKKSVSLKLTDRRGRVFHMETRYAAIQLITIPFVSLRHLLEGDMLDQPRQPAELMQSVIRDTPKLLVINLAEGKIVYGRTELDMHPARLALYAFFAERKKNCDRDTPCSDCDVCFLETSAIIEDAHITRLYRKIPGSRLVDEMSSTGIGSLSKENFNSYKSKIRGDLLAGFGQAVLADLEIAAHGGRPETRYGIRLDKSMIRIEW